MNEMEKAEMTAIEILDKNLDPKDIKRLMAIQILKLIEKSRTESTKGGLTYGE